MTFCVGLGLWSGPVTFAENLLLFSIALYFFIKNSPEDSKIFRLNKHAVEILRVGTGICLIVLAFTEKLAYPELSLAFLQAHHWNFMQPFFPNFSDSLFVLSVVKKLYPKGKIVVSPKLWVYTSGRRYGKNGLLNTVFKYVVNYFSMLFWDKPYHHN
jgi:hypothetical protein